MDMFGAEVNDNLVVDARAMGLKICKSCLPKIMVYFLLKNLDPFPD
jgi:hypothetical protein